jgi:membrane-associated phospholipid phosphatase
MRLITGFLAMAWASIMDTSASEWDRWRADRRVVVVHAGAADETRARHQLVALAADPGGLAVRDIVLLRSLGDEDPRAWPSGETAVSAAHLAGLYPALRKARWTVLLIGRDGEAKAIWHRPVSLAHIFAKIDAMPMGRREKQERERPSR